MGVQRRDTGPPHRRPASRGPPVQALPLVGRGLHRGPRGLCPDGNRTTYRRALRSKRSQYYADVLDHVDSAEKLWKVMGWRKPAGCESLPLVSHPGEPVPTDRAEAVGLVHRVALGSPVVANDLPASTLSPRDEGAPVEALAPAGSPPDFHETYKAFVGPGSTAPGEDGVTVAHLKAAWDPLYPRLKGLVEAVFRVGHYPRVFRHASVTLIPKPGRADLTLAGNWRPISLLSCIGKGLERLLATRMARLAADRGDPELFTGSYVTPQ